VHCFWQADLNLEQYFNRRRTVVFFNSSLVKLPSNINLLHWCTWIRPS